MILVGRLGGVCMFNGWRESYKKEKFIKVV